MRVNEVPAGTETVEPEPIEKLAPVTEPDNANAELLANTIDAPLAEMLVDRMSTVVPVEMLMLLPEPRVSMPEEPPFKVTRLADEIWNPLVTDS